MVSNQEFIWPSIWSKVNLFTQFYRTRLFFYKVVLNQRFMRFNIEKAIDCRFYLVKKSLITFS